ncbi:MAG: hypothetical protein KJP21_05590, partial [Bacteroidia bacterium]|nr:hypothetical protein [Bacteroidia bacterium]
TELGKEWGLWMAYRELVSNTIDENGKFDSEPITDKTTIVVTGKEIDECYRNHENYFCSKRKKIETIVSKSTHLGIIEIMEGEGKIYYKDVYVGNMENAEFDYNLLKRTGIQLTEDRTIKNIWDVKYCIGSIIGECTNKAVIEKYITAAGFESQIEYFYEPKEKFFEVMKAKWESDPTSLNKMAINELNKKVDTKNFDQFKPTEMQVKSVEKAVEFLNKNEVGVEMRNIKFVEIKDQSTIAFVYKKIIHLTPKALQEGMFQLVRTLLEEQAHVEGYHDECRKFEDYLMKKIIYLMQEKHGEML